MQKCDLLIKGADVLINSGELRENVDIAIADGRILAVDAGLAQAYEADEVLDGRYKLFMPGLVDSHMHTGQQLLKGLVLDAKPIIWTRVIFPLRAR